MKYKRILPKQKPNIPEINNCSCGNIAELQYIWDYLDSYMNVYQVCCNNCNNTGPACSNAHRAISRWNKKNPIMVKS